MTEEEFLKALTEIPSKGWDGGLVDFRYDDQILLDGYFSVEQLRKIVDLVDEYLAQKMVQA